MKKEYHEERESNYTEVLYSIVVIQEGSYGICLSRIMHRRKKLFYAMSTLDCEVECEAFTDTHPALGYTRL